MRKNSFLTLITVVTIITVITFACKKSSTAPSTPTKYFASVRTIINNDCKSCHSGGTPAGNTDLSTDANIAAKATRIKVRAIDGTGGFMPQGAISRQYHGADSTAIVNWAAAGGKATD